MNIKKSYSAILLLNPNFLRKKLRHLHKLYIGRYFHGNTFLYTAYADDATFFLRNLGSIKGLLNKISLYSSFLALKPNLSKCEVDGIGLLKGVKVAVCGIKCIDLTKDAIKILGIFFFV